MKKSIIIFLSVLAVTLTFSGCGSEGSSVSEGPISETSASSADVTPNVGSDTTPAEVEGTLTKSKVSLEDIFGAVPANPGNS